MMSKHPKNPKTQNRSYKIAADGARTGRRRVLKQAGLAATLLAYLPEYWQTPVIKSVFLPAHGTPSRGQDKEEMPERVRATTEQLPWFRIQLEEPDLTLDELQGKTEIYLWGKGITRLPEGIFSGLPNLVSLWLSSNALTALPRNIFAGLVNLQELSLSHNQLNTLPVDVFHNLPALGQLSLEGNGLTVNRVNVETWGLDINNLPHGIALADEPRFGRYGHSHNYARVTIDNLTHVQTEQFPSMTLPRASGGNAPLSYALSPNRLPSGLTFNPATRVLSGSPDAISPTTEYTYAVTDVDSDTDTLTFTITIIAFPTAQLTWFRIHYDRTITLQQLRASASLYLHNKALTQLPDDIDIFAGLTNLTDLYLYGNRLHTLPANIFSGLSNLTRLELHDNSLSNLPDNIFQALPLAKLYLHNNDLTLSRANLRRWGLDPDNLPEGVHVAHEPDFGRRIIAHQYYILNSPVTVILPQVSRGDAPLSYSLEPDLPTGLAFTATTRILSGTPAVIRAATQYTYTVTDNDGDTATLSFTMTIAADTAPRFATSMEAQIYTQNLPIGYVTLPQVIGGNEPLSYSLRPGLLGPSP